VKKIGFKGLFLNHIFFFCGITSVSIFPKNFFESNFCSRFIKDSIKGTPKNVKKPNKSSQKVLKIDF
jgi:hypothetical protein